MDSTYSTYFLTRVPSYIKKGRPKAYFNQRQKKPKEIILTKTIVKLINKDCK